MSVRTNRLRAAIACALCAATGVANAVSVDPRGVGQVLLFPYYTANAGNQTLLSVVNTTDRVKAIRVRFREGLNSRAVLDINLYLAPFDTWVAAVFKGVAEPARVITNDTSCTFPELTPGVEVPFRNYQYTGSQQDFPSSQVQLGSLARTREGHVEMIEMGELSPGTGPTQLAEEASFAAGATQPRDCTRFRAAWTPPSGEWALNGTRDISVPTCGLHGSASVVDVANGAMVSFAAIALADFYTDATAPGALHGLPGSNEPDLTDANNGGGVARADVVVDGIGPVTEAYVAGAGANPVSLVLMQTALVNDYVADPALGASTEWVVTFPTRSYYSDVASDVQVVPPFAEAFRDDGRAEQPVHATQFTRETFSTDDPCNIDTLPPPGCGPEPSFTMDYGVNVLAFASEANVDIVTTPILGAAVGTVARVLPSPFVFQQGWARLRLYEPPVIGDGAVIVGPTSGIRYRGLPAIGFGVTRFVNGNARPGLIANYAGGQSHRSTLEAVLIEAASQAGDPTR